MMTRPQLPCRPTNVSRVAMFDPEFTPVSPLTLDSIWKTALRPPPRLSVPRIPKRDELLLTRFTVGFVFWFTPAVLVQAVPPPLWLAPVCVPRLPAPAEIPPWQVEPLTNSK